jgi:hypothetical protein
MSDFKARNLRAIRSALDDHNADCTTPARAILLNPVDHALLGWEELWGVPLRADPRVAAKRFRIDCSGSAWGIEDELDLHLEAPDTTASHSARH